MASYRVGPDLTDNQLLRQRIERALKAAPGLDLASAAAGLLEVLGYLSERRPLAQSGRVDDFIDDFSALNQDTRSENEFRENATAVRVLFQFTSDEIPAGLGQGTLFECDDFDTGNAQSFMFRGGRPDQVQLSARAPTRGSPARSTSGCWRPRSSSFARRAASSRWPLCIAARTSSTPSATCWAAFH